MKQKVVYCVLLATAVYMPASSKECGKFCKQVTVETVLHAKNKGPVELEEISVLPASPFSRLFLNL